MLPSFIYLSLLKWITPTKEHSFYTVGRTIFSRIFLTLYIYSFVFFTEEKAVTLDLFPAGLAVRSAPFRREISYPFI